MQRLGLRLLLGELPSSSSYWVVHVPEVNQWTQARNVAEVDRLEVASVLIRSTDRVG